MTPRVCVVSALYHPTLGGLGRQAQILTEGLRRAGVELFVIARQMDGMPPAAFAPEVEVVRLPTPWARVHILEERSPRNLVISLAFSLRCARLLRRRRRHYELVHFHGASLPLLISLPLLKRLGKTVLAKVAAANLGSEAGSLAGRYGGIGSALARLARRADAFVAISAEIEEGLHRDGIPRARIHRLANVVDTTRFHRPAPGERASLREGLGLPPGRLVLFAGRLVQRKGVGVLLEAWREVGRRFPEARLLMLGDGPERQRLERMARAADTADSVEFRGAVSNVEPYLRACDMFVLPSLQEGMPNALLEAFASGLPAVATRIGGVTDVCAVAGGAVLVTAGNAAELAAGLGRLLGDESLRDDLSRQTLSVASHFGLEQRVRDYVDLYGSLAGAREGALA